MPPKIKNGVKSAQVGEDVERLDTFVPRSARRPSSIKRTPRKRAVGDPHGATGSPKRDNISTPSKKPKLEPKATVAKNAPKIVIGLDFGTTFSGMAYTWSERLDQIAVLTNIDSSNKEYEKVPTAIEFVKNGVTIRPNWGNFAQHAPGSLKWFKLLLLNDEDLRAEVRNSEHIRAARARLEEFDMTVTEVIGRYLKELWEGALVLIKADASQATVANSRFHVVVTLPAIWPDYAKEGMREAARIAGILKRRPGVSKTVLTFISEPEAAALATLKRINGRCDIEPNDCFVVCDAGGGTVDIISYMLNSTQPMEVCEIVDGTGALCGALYVDEQIILLLRKKFAKVSAVPWDQIDLEELQDIVDAWNVQRNSFSGQNSKSWIVRLPDSLLPHDHRGARPKILITPEDMRDVFQPSIEKIETMISEQVSAINEKQGKHPKYIILVGGYGRCPYLRHRLGARFPAIEVLQSQGSEPWTAISRGAVIHGLTSEKLDSEFSVEVRSRISRASYGVLCQEAFDASKHLEEDKVWDPYQKTSLATNQMKWLVKKGDVVAVGRKLEHHFFKFVKEQDDLDSFCTSIWMCNASPPPSRKDDSVTRYSDVKWNAMLDVDMLPFCDECDDESLRRLDYKAEMKCDGGSAEFAIFHNGKRQAAASVSVEFHDHAIV